MTAPDRPAGPAPIVTTGIAAGPGGIMTVEVGAITGDLRTVWDGRRALLTVQYDGADEWYTVEGPPVSALTAAEVEAVHQATADAVRRAGGATAAGGKEIRLLGALPWFRARYRAEAVGCLTQLWKERRRLLLRPFLGLAAVALLGGGGAFLVLATAVPAGEDGARALALTVQCLLVPLRFGVYFPESDVQTQYGLLAHRALTDFEEQAGREPRPDHPRPVPRQTEGIAFREVSFGYPGA
ncbi:hypothetical protein ACFWNB_41000, partial [Kitasatospora purpeofusca]